MTTPAVSSAYRAYVLFILVVVYTFNFIDRQIVGILAIPIKEDLGLSDTQLSLMGGLAFALFYTFLGIPIAALADRKSRTWIMTIALSVWSAMTALCGLAQNFLQLFLARLGVGVGEAGGVAPAYSLISDYFPPNQRARALSVYSFGIPIGSALGIILGGILTDIIGWRSAFVIVGLLGLLIAPIFRLTMREPKRGQYDPPSANVEPAPFKQVVNTLLQKRSFWLLSIGAASSSMMGYGLIFWLPSFFVRSFGEALPEFMSFIPSFLLPAEPTQLSYAAYFYGTILFVGGLIGIWAGGFLADKFGQRSKAAYALIPAWAFVATIPFFLIGVLADTLLYVFLSFIVIQALVLAWLGPVLSAFQHLVPPNMRATASAIFLFINNLIGIGLGNLAIGAISDALSASMGDESLRYAILCGVVFYVLAALFLFMTASRLEQDWEK
ncbi:MFS transporter [Parvularcula sp. IMCC14364]|uniref:spinster family MFS transporter n=1 Tax=Parvularcula sp. IMCC14364 TaxID=3067902 RepID=UPI002740E348|nr:MFS transporter [Parvularcula sp. IMCC14364]